MRPILLVSLICAGPALINAVIMDDTVYQEKYTAPKAIQSVHGIEIKKGDNLLEANFKVVFKLWKEVEKIIQGDVSGWNKDFKHCWEFLYGKTPPDGDAALKEIRDRMKFSVEEYPEVFEVKPRSKSEAAGGKDIPLYDFIFYPDFSRLEHDKANKVWKIKEGKEEYEHEFSEEKIAQYQRKWNPTAQNTKMWTRALDLNAGPTGRPNIMQMTETWSNHIEATRGFFGEDEWYPKAFKNQKILLPNYKFDATGIDVITKDLSDTRKPTKENAEKLKDVYPAGETFVTLEIASGIVKTFLHEFGHMTFVETPNTKSHLIDIVNPQNKNDKWAYHIDRNVQRKNKDNTNNLAFLIMCYDLIHYYGYRCDRLGMWEAISGHKPPA